MAKTIWYHIASFQLICILYYQELFNHPRKVNVPFLTSAFLHNHYLFSQVNFTSGAFVRYKVYPWSGTYYANIEVQVPSDDYRNTSGLCGTPGNTKKKEMEGKNGTIFRIAHGSVAPSGFTESWKYEYLFDVLF